MITTINQTKKGLDNLIPIGNVKDDNDLLGAEKEYKSFDMNSSDPVVGDDFFPVVKDYLMQIRPGAKGLLISQAQKTQQGYKRYYKISMNQGNGQAAIFYLTFDTTYITV